MRATIYGLGSAAWAAFLFVVTASASGAAAPGPGLYDVAAYGASGNGTDLDTAAIQAAIDACAEDGGGTVYVHNGRFLTGTLFLRSNVTLHIEGGAELLGSTKLEDYPVTVPAYRSYTDNYTERSLLYAEKAEGAAVLGRGTVDGQGAAFSGPYKMRPYLIRMIECRNVQVSGVTLQNSPMWVQHYLACEDVTIDGITVKSKVNKNNDGIDIDSCSRVRIANCAISSGDDAIVLKSTSDRVCRDVTVTNCVVSSDCNGLKLGTESNGGFQNITITNCTVYDTRLAGIAIELVDGGILDGVNVSSIVMDNARGGIFIRLGNRARPYLSTGVSKGAFTPREDARRPGIGSVRNVLISNVQATGVEGTGCSITGLPGHPVENVTLENVRMVYAGGGTREQALRAIPEQEEAYPEYNMFGPLPAYGFYVRHVHTASFHHMKLDLAQGDQRPALVFDDVRDVDILDFDGAPSGEALMAFRDVDGALIHGCRPSGPVGTFVRLEGAGTKDIALVGNELTRVKQVVATGEGVQETGAYQVR